MKDLKYKIVVLNNGTGQLLNPYLYDQSKPSEHWQAFNQTNPPYKIINPGLAKEGETVSGKLVWQHMFYEQQGWITGPVHENAQQERQAFLIDGTPKEGEATGHCGGNSSTAADDLGINVNNWDKIKAVAKPFDAVDGNRLIAEFMGCELAFAHEVDEHGYTQTVDGYKFVYGKDFVLPISVKELQYHSSWDWLMPVVEKIETMDIDVPEKYQRGFMKNTKIATVEIITIYDNRDEFKGWTWWISFVAGNHIKETDIRVTNKLEATYKAVVEFIKWYNLKNS